MKSPASTLQMPLLSDRTQEDLMSFLEGELELADEFLEDAVVHLQRRQFFGAAESLRDAAQTVNLVEQYLPLLAEGDQLLHYQANLSNARQRVHVLEQSLTPEGTRSP